MQPKYKRISKFLKLTHFLNNLILPIYLLLLVSFLCCYFYTSGTSGRPRAALGFQWQITSSGSSALCS